MKILNLQTVLLVGGLGLFCDESHAAIIISIDMDPNTAGIQSTRTSSVGDTFTANLVFDLGASYPAGLSGYSVRVRFDTVELSLNGSPAATESGPAGWINLTAGVDYETETLPSPNSGLGELNTFESATFGAGINSGSFIAGSIMFSVASVSDDGLADIFPHFGAGDGLWDGSGTKIDSLTATLNSGAVVPEPQTYGLCAGLGLLGWAAYRRWRRAV